MLTGIPLQWHAGEALRIPMILRSCPLRGKLNGQPIENISGLIGGFQLRKPLKLCMLSANYALMANVIPETWDCFPIFHAMLLGNMKKSKKYLLSQANLIQSSLPLVIAKRKQTEHEKILGKLFIHEIIPLNLVRSQLFRDFRKLSISRVFSCLLNKSTMFF